MRLLKRSLRKTVLLTVRTLSGCSSLKAPSLDGEPFRSDFGILVEDTRRIGHWSMLRSMSCICKQEVSQINSEFSHGLLLFLTFRRCVWYLQKLGNAEVTKYGCLSGYLCPAMGIPKDSPRTLSYLRGTFWNFCGGLGSQSSLAICRTVLPYPQLRQQPNLTEETSALKGCYAISICRITL